MTPSKEDLKEWQELPVTKYVMLQLQTEIEVKGTQIALGGTIDWGSPSSTGQKTAHQSGRLEALARVINVFGKGEGAW